MKRLLFLLAVVGIAGWVQAATPVYITPDVPTDETLTGTTILQEEVRKYTGAAYTPESLGPLPPNTRVDAIHKLDKPGDWLFSVESATDFPVFGFTAEPRDVVRYTSSTGVYSLFFCGGSIVPDTVPAGSNVDAAYIDGPDGADLILSFDVPTTIAPFTFDPGDLARWVSTGPLCSDWGIAAANPELDFDVSNTVAPPDAQYNVTGADKVGGDYVLAFDVPTDAAPPGATFLPDELVELSAGAWASWETLVGWPANLSSSVDGLSCLANPGQVPVTITVDKSTITPGDLTISWAPSCADGAEDYGIYEGTIGSWYTHTRKDCSDAGADLTEEIMPTAPSSTSRYYLVVPLNLKDGEGSYGNCSTGVCLAGDERPVGTLVCTSPQLITPCPP